MMYLILELGNVSPRWFLIDTYVQSLDHLLLHYLYTIPFF